MRVLIVEDHADTARVMNIMFTRAGHDVLSAGSAAEALRLCEKAPSFDVLICDLSLPDGDGWHLLAELRQRCDAKAIAVSGHGMPAHVEQSRAAGFDAHLIKPVTFAQVMATILQLTEAGAPALG